MIITDTLLASREAAGSPIRVGIAGPGFMAKGRINHITNTVAGQVSRHSVIRLLRDNRHGQAGRERPSARSGGDDCISTRGRSRPAYASL